MPNHLARAARWAAGISATVRATLSSRATTVPASTVASMAAPAATPAAARSAVGARLASLTAESLKGYPSLRIVRTTRTLPVASDFDHSSCYVCG